MNEDAFAAAWFAGVGVGGFDDHDAARRVLGARERERDRAAVRAQVIISVSLDDLEGMDGDLLV